MNNLISFIHNELASGRIPRGGIPGDAPHADELNRLVVYLTSIQQFSMALANGDLSATLTDVKGPVAGSLKSLHASLKHLTWQTKQIAAGDFSQRVDFMGEFSDAFNIMVQRLDQSRTALEVLNLRLREDNIKLQNLADELREKEERLRHIAENVSDVIWTLDSAMEGFTYVSPSIASLRGLSVDEALREPLERTMTQESLAHLRSRLSDRVTDPGSMGKAGALSEKMEIEQICRDGRTISVEVVITAITDANGRLKEFVGVSRDITARKQIEDRLKYQSSHDALTGLHNRAFFDSELELTIRGKQFPVSVIVADLDGLKQVNDNLGHGTGDLLIKGAATIFRMAFRGNDILARTGGDEFVMLLRDMDQEGAAAALDRIRSCMHTYNAKNGEPLVSISLGAATAQTAEDVPAALNEADGRMYDDKVRRRRQRKDCS